MRGRIAARLVQQASRSQLGRLLLHIKLFQWMLYTTETITPAATKQLIISSIGSGSQFSMRG
jgi:hypothetical protein